MTTMSTFADGFTGTKVATTSGDPLVVHHQTWEGNHFETFDRLAMCRRYGRDPESINAVGAWFTDSPNLTKYGQKNFDAYLAIANPIIYSDEPDVAAWVQLERDIAAYGGATGFRHYLKTEGVDGIALEKTFLDGETQTVWIALEPEQVHIIPGPKNTLHQEDKPMSPVDKLVSTLRAIHHQLSKGEASDGDQRDIRWCTRSAAEALADYDGRKDRVLTKEGARPSYDELLSALRAINDRGVFEDSGNFVIERTWKEEGSSDGVAEIANARALIERVSEHEYAARTENQNSAADIIVMMENGKVSVLADVSITATLVDYDTSSAEQHDIRYLSAGNGMVEEVAVVGLPVWVRPERVKEIQEVADQAPVLGMQP